MKALITGGAGYIGSTIASAMEDNGYTPIILDSLVTGRKEFASNKIFYHGDIADRHLLQRIFREHPDIFCVIHCAALIVVTESVIHPYQYYRENVSNSLELFKAIVDCGCPRVIFSSSASVYDVTPTFQVHEDSPLRASSPYARSKIMMEQILEDFCHAYALQGIALRYFNPIGADPKFRSGPYIEHPSHLLGSLVEVATGRKDLFELHGTRWPTRDGSAMRDYIHVWDLARAHVLAAEKFQEVLSKNDAGSGNYCVINLATGNGVTVREFLAAFEKVHGRTVNKIETEPRPGDAAGACASCEKAYRLLGWKVEKSLEQGIADALAWDQKRKTVLGY